MEAFADGLPEGIKLPDDMTPIAFYEETGEEQTVSITENTVILSQDEKELDASDLEAGWVITVTALGEEAQTITVGQADNGRFMEREDGMTLGLDMEAPEE